MACASEACRSSVPPMGMVEEIDEATIRFAGDVSDGMQLARRQFTAASAAHGNHVCTLPDPPAEIRAATGTLAGVCGVSGSFQQARRSTRRAIASHALVAMNPAALQANLGDLEAGGIADRQCRCLHAGRIWRRPAMPPIRSRTARWPAIALMAVPMNQLNREAVARVNLSPREAERCKNFFALGLVFWLYRSPAGADAALDSRDVRQEPGR